MPISAFHFLEKVIREQRHRHPEDDEDALRARFSAGEVVLRDGTTLRPEDLVAPGTDIFFYRIPAPERRVPFEIDTIFEDENLMVVRKPPFLATMPRASHITESVTVRLRRATSNEELTPAHRLDRLTSGLLLLTKRREVRGAYQELFAQRRVKKLYEAIGPEVSIPAPTRWEHHLDKVPGELRTRIDSGQPPNSATDVLSISPIDANTVPGGNDAGTPLARYLLQPLTGRTHQLRAHMALNAAGIVGDPLYPVVTRPAEDFGRPLLLASVELSFQDPLSGTSRVFRCVGW
ncbi:Ribosomal large subunit pseudouridine synthase A [Corynebacterium capitovis DSM 44611]|uniref:pseudouridine synthase n=1 Tax=Corynebacterium capitovis TaxID=131081 RepID=UPI000361F203|nr:pseudouridine synthase [Corynebacterium capitovis]WKD58334.1 Ribosomal large subunit pseudouridine synthase A [Corynebacterium capitovis DSM 44611]